MKDLEELIISEEDNMKIEDIYMTCSACPSQWEGFLEDGRMFYARYRWGHLTLDLSIEPTDDVYTAMDGEEIISKTIGDQYDGVMTTEELLSIMEAHNFEI